LRKKRKFVGRILSVLDIKDEKMQGMRLDTQLPEASIQSRSFDPSFKTGKKAHSHLGLVGNTIDKLRKPKFC